MNDPFIIGAYWGERAASLIQIKDQILQTLNCLARIDIEFSSWYETGMSRKDALAQKIKWEDDVIIRQCIESVRKGELNEQGFSKMGFLFSLWNGRTDEESSSLSFNVGKSSQVLINNCIVTLPYEGVAKDRLLEQKKVLAIMSILIDIWNPDNAVFSSEALRSNIGGDIDGIGWVTYSRCIKHMPKISPNLVHETKNNGHLFYLANGHSYDYSLLNELRSLKKRIT
ncbi:hypothetical protein DVR12_27455 [Chitinophaga silvatica]|uniref:Immunity protein 52 domain-containing protein n=1 Tax=Chitinophaga silvatica TaxID=2282649 RepID=A0A3E1Y1U6_9BACT|nr:Imm52 family immunity protein [Chitinophaga silvatica]RFS18652.1 hypothetical protein DVR12_27455 [Chitinophaga silvatica]